MADNISTVVDLVHPVPSGIGVIVSDQVWVVFDHEIDETTVSQGNFFLTGPDFDTWSGPDLQLYLDSISLGDESEILQSPGYEGLVAGEITFERVALASLTSVNTLDTVGSGVLFRTKAIFTPTNRLQADTTYRVWLSGDEDENDTLKTGISSRTVFDPVASGFNTSTGECSFTGGYVGLVNEDTYRVQITTGGELGTAKFNFFRDSDPLSTFGPFYARRSGVLLSDGVTAEFTEGNYVQGDAWSVIVKERNIFLGNLNWEFLTGSGSIETLPTTTSTSVIGTPLDTTATATTSAFTVSSSSPADAASHTTIPAGDYDITVTFNKNIDDTTISGQVTVFAESVTGETNVVASGFLLNTPSASGKILTITVPEGQLFNNNLVTVTLDSTIAATDGSALDTDYSFSFTTFYTPYYCTLRQLRLRVGAFLADLADDTLNLAIHFASKEAGYLTWNKENLEDEYYKFVRNQWTCCRSAQILLNNVVGSGGLKSKKLGDLEVEYDTRNAMKPLASAEDCLAKWEGALLAGGAQVQSPQAVVKGDLDIDRPPIGRGWLHERDFDNSQMPAASRRIRPINSQGYVSRRYRNAFSRFATRKAWWDR